MNSKPAAQMNPSFWDERYQKGRFMFSTKPNAFLVEQVPEKGGKALAVGDGEGRNGVWLAEQGWSVTSLDYSQEGIAKTQQLATQRGVALETVCADASQWDYPEAHFDLIVLFYFHLPREPAKVAHRGCVKALRPGGRLILEGFRKEQMPLLARAGRVWRIGCIQRKRSTRTLALLDARINRAVGRVLREGRLRGSAAVYQYVGHKAD